MVILQKDSYLSIDYLKQRLLITRKGEEGTEGVQVDEVARENDALETQLKAFLQSVRGRTPPVVTGEDGQRALEVAFRIADAIDDAMKAKG
jgi:predicted dehydrogenase